MLSSNAQKVIHRYLNLPFKGLNGVRCPYFNNARAKQRGQLRVLVGKGSPEEIVDEAHIISIQYNTGLFHHEGDCYLHHKFTGQPVTPDNMRQFLIDNNLGIECSGFVTHVLRAHFLETKQIDLIKKIKIPTAKLTRKIIAKLRPIENIDVRIYANDNNSQIIANNTVGWNYEKIQPGDIIIMLETGTRANRNHIMLITEITNNELHYAHARAWSSEGKYGHGVTIGKIIIKNPNKNLVGQEWLEKDLTGDQNESHTEAKLAKILEIRRLKM